MSDVASARSPAASPKEKKKPAAAKKPATHPKYSEMVKVAIQTLKERGGSSRQAITKYILKNYTVGADEKMVNSRVKLALKAGLSNNDLKQSKGNGASGSFKLGEKPPVVKKSPKKVAVKKPAEKKPEKKSTPKKAVKKVAKKPTAGKNAKSPAKKVKIPG